MKKFNTGAGVFVPLFHFNDTLFLFDHVDGYMERYQATDGTLIDKESYRLL